MFEDVMLTNVVDSVNIGFICYFLLCTVYLLASLAVLAIPVYIYIFTHRLRYPIILAPIATWLIYIMGDYLSNSLDVPVKEMMLYVIYSFGVVFSIEYLVGKISRNIKGR